MNRAELLEHNERSLAQTLDEIAERRARENGPHIDAREWVSPPCEAPSHITRADVDRAVAAAIRQSDERLIDALSSAAQVIGQEVAAITDPMARQISQLKAEVKALREGRPCPTIIKP
jgi:hypothetical protein